MAEQPTEKPDAGSAPDASAAAQQPPAAVSKVLQQAASAATQRRDDEDPDATVGYEERGDIAYWRERAGRLGTTPHHIAGALAHLPGDATFDEADVRQFVRDFEGREERHEGGEDAS